jgi:hypothetical protein
VLEAIADMEAQQWARYWHCWRPWRGVEAGMARLREDYQPTALAA